MYQTTNHLWRYGRVSNYFTCVIPSSSLSRDLHFSAVLLILYHYFEHFYAIMHIMYYVRDLCAKVNDKKNEIVVLKCKCTGKHQ